jgi:hypothetical protein
LLSTSEFFSLLDTHPSVNECEKSALTEAQQVTIAQAQNIRNQLSSPATGCRISVWAAVEKGMDADTKLLFANFNRGLALPDSTIELWERLNGFMQWLEVIANGDNSQAL